MSIDPTKDSAEHLLQALAVRDLEPFDPRVIARFAAEPELATRWEQLAATLVALTDFGGGPEPTLVSAAEVRPMDTMAAIRAFRRESSRGPRWWLAISAAALVAASLMIAWLMQSRSAPPVDPRLGGGSTTLAPDRAAWPEGVPLSWVAVRGAASYRLQLRPLPDGPTVSIPGGPFGLGSLTVNEWLPSTDQRSKLPSRFQWRVITLDGANDEIATSAWAETWR